GSSSSDASTMNNRFYKTQMPKEVQEKHKLYVRIYLQFLAIAGIFIIIFFGVRVVIPDENISRFIIFPLFIVALFIMIKLAKKMTWLRKEIKSIHLRTNSQETD